MDKINAEKIFTSLNEMFPSLKSELNFSTNFELFVAVILSAQCTDKRVNIITKELFANYNTPEKIAAMNVNELENIIRSCGLYKSKAKNIIACSKKLLEKHSGVVPSDLESLIELDGVGRKTANVIRAVAFKEPAIAVDTHVFRVANRIGLTSAKNVTQSENQLMKLLSKDKWIDWHFLLVIFGRYHCTARNPKCSTCKINEKCKYYNEVVKKDVRR